MDLERSSKVELTKKKKKKHSYYSTNIILSILAGFSVLILVQWRVGLPNNSKNRSNINLISKLRDSVTFLPLKDLRFSNNPMEGNTWFMSSFNDTRNKNEAAYLYFPSKMSKGRLLCFKGNNTRDGTANSYALAWPESLPHSAKLIQGLTFVSETYYDYVNLWHGLDAMTPFVSWSLNNECIKPDRWLLFHWGEVRSKMGSWLEQLIKSSFGQVKIMEQGHDEVPYCLERAVVMRHNGGGMGNEKKLQVCDFLRCKARTFCGLDLDDEKGKPLPIDIIRPTLLMRRGSRFFKNATAVIDIFSRECAKVQGCVFKVAHSDDLSFCDQVKVMSNTDIVASPHGAQLTNMVFMDRNSSVMEFFPKGWLELAGIGQYAHHWMAVQSGMIHQGAWWEPLDKMECPSPHNTLHCFNFYKNGNLGHNETLFAQWTSTVLNQVKARKQAIHDRDPRSTTCSC